VTDWEGYVIRKISISLDNNFVPLPSGFYDNHYQWTRASEFYIVRAPAWPMVQNDGVLNTDPDNPDDARFDAPKLTSSPTAGFDSGLDILAFTGGYYPENPMDPSDVALQLASDGEFVHILSFLSGDTWYYGSDATNIDTGFGEHGVWQYEMRRATGKKYTQM
jgi:hypothetical protein